MALTDFQTLVDAMVRDDDSRITQDERDAAIVSAVSRYSEDRPRRHVVDVVAAGGQLLDLPPDWEADFSHLVALEYPVGSVPPTYLPADQWGLYEAPGAIKIMSAIRFGAGDQVRCTHTVRHVVDGVSDTVPLGYREPVCAYAASLLLDQLAALTVNVTDASISADAIAHRTKSQEYAARARVQRQRYLDALGLSATKNAAHGVVVDLDLTDSRGRDRLTHPGRFR